MKVFEGKILRIHLSPLKISYENFDAYREFIGGRGVNQYILLSELPHPISPFDPSSILTIGAGILVGIDVPGACRLSIDSKNALTDGIGSGNCGGYFASEMRFAGMNHIVITGRCPDLSYLYIHYGETKIIDAKDLKTNPPQRQRRLLKEGMEM